jgi:hypothetical protein
MFETESFKKQLESAISAEAGSGGLTQYETAIIAHLQRLAADNESTLMERELRKAASERRSVLDALNNARSLAREACRYAAAEKRTVLELSDIDTAYRAKFCQFWPFCK